jgi:tetratricopeptide (TPR) repeat protein
MDARQSRRDAEAQARESVREAKAQARESIQEAKAQMRDARAQAEAQARDLAQQGRDLAQQARELAQEAKGLAQESKTLSITLPKDPAHDAKTLTITLPGEAALAAARRLRMQGGHDEAAKIYQKFIAENPNSARLFEARFWLAKCRLAGQKWDEAADAFTDFLGHHSDQRTYSQQAKEDRIYCWKVRLGRNPKAAPGLKAALGDQSADIRALAALALAEGRDASGRDALEENLGHPRLGEQCGLALWKLGLRDRPKPGEAPWARMLVVKVRHPDPDGNFEMRVPVNFFRSVVMMLPEDAREAVDRKGIGSIMDLAASAPKGQELFQFRGGGGKTSVVISVE